MSDEYVYGVHAVASLLEADPSGIIELWLQSRRRQPVVERALERARNHEIRVHRVPRATLDRMLPEVRHQGIVVRYRGRRSALAVGLDDVVDRAAAAPLLLFLDEVQDPHNLGACLRTAAAAAADAVVVPRNRSPGLTPSVRKVACGAAEVVPLVSVANAAAALERIADRGLQRIGTAPEAEMSIFDADLSGGTALVLGSEDRGLRRLTREHCDLLVRIPIDARMESLNLSVAAGICLFEARRQRALRA